MTHEELKRWCIVLKTGGASIEEAQKALHALVATNGDNPGFLQTAFTELEIVYSRKQEKPPVSTQVLEYSMKTFGTFGNQDVYRDLNFMGEADKSSCRRTLRDLVDKKILARIPGKDGFYRRIDETIKVLPWQQADINSTMDIIFPPFGLEKLVKIYPGSVIVIAGATNAGKTGFLLNFVKGNMYQYPINYYTNELGAAELKNRLKYFEGVDWKFTAIQRSKEYSDLVRVFPDHIHVIDYLAVYDSFYRIGQEISDIFDSLNKGVAVIAIQKDTDTKFDKKMFGRGGAFTAERARLYLTLDANKLTVVKAKNWRDELENPDGKVYKFKLTNGCFFHNIVEVKPEL